VRLPPSNTPVTNVASTDIRCNVGGTKGVSAKCPVKAGDTVTVEMHQQPGDRSCKNEAIGGDHYGPVSVYLAKVSDAASSDGSGSYFKIYQDVWAPKAGASSGDNDYWGTEDMNSCCGHVDVKIPADIAPGDYILRAEVLALHVAMSSGNAQFYMSCYQITVTGNGTATPAGVSFPGVYKASDPGILVNIHQPITTYAMPGPTVYAGGSTKSAGSPCDSGCEKTCTPGSGGAGTAVAAPAPANTGSSSSGNSGGGGSSSCTVQKYQQCGGIGYTGCTSCAVSSTRSGIATMPYANASLYSLDRLATPNRHTIASAIKENLVNSRSVDILQPILSKAHHGPFVSFITPLAYSSTSIPSTLS
jgi:lytic cellulose monooxygenase (C1-hydroxylating)